MAFEGSFISFECVQDIVCDFVLAVFTVEVFLFILVAQEAGFDEHAGSIGRVRDAPCESTCDARQRDANLGSSPSSARIAASSNCRYVGVGLASRGLR